MHCGRLRFGRIHPSGTLIKSSAPIAVTISDDSLLVTFQPSGCYDIMVTKSFLLTWQAEYIAIKAI